MTLAALVLLALGASRVGRLGLEGSLTTAALRAAAQLALVSLIITAALSRLWAVGLFVVVMFVAATLTSAGRIEARRNWGWCALGLAGGVVPVLVIIFVSRIVPIVGPAVIAISGIIIGGSMTAQTLTAQRAFDSLRDEVGVVEAGLALGLPRPTAITNVIARHAPRALTPILDQTRTVGLVTLPGAFVGVLLGGGSPAEAAAAQVLVLVGLLATETLVVVGTQRLIAAGRILSTDLRTLLPT